MPHARSLQEGHEDSNPRPSELVRFSTWCGWICDSISLAERYKIRQAGGRDIVSPSSKANHELDPRCQARRRKHPLQERYNNCMIRHDHCLLAVNEGYLHLYKPNRLPDQVQGLTLTVLVGDRQFENMKAAVIDPTGRPLREVCL